MMDIKKISVFLLITCNIEKRDEVLTEISHLDSIAEVQGTFGAYDIVVKIEQTSLANSKQFIIEKIHTIGNIRSAIMLPCKPILQ